MMCVKNRSGERIYVKDWGSGRPIVLIHGWPLSADSWDRIGLALAESGFRVVAYDRKGFGRSEQPWDGYDYDTLSSDLADIIAELGLSELTLVGFSMGGGEVARYMSRFDASGVRSVALISSIVPFMLQTSDNSQGVPESVFEGIIEKLKADRPNFYDSFFDQFYGAGMLTSPVSKEWKEWTIGMAMQGSLKATIDCVNSFGKTDFRPDLLSFNVPTLIVHGTDDQTVPIDATGRAAAAKIDSATLIEYEGAPHGLFATHTDRLIQDLIEFCKRY